MLSSIADDVNGERCRQTSAMVWVVDKYKGKDVFKVNERDKYKDKKQTNLVTFFLYENERKLF